MLKFVSLKRYFVLFFLFITIFLTKLQHKYDVPIIFGTLFLLHSLIKGRFFYPIRFVPPLLFLVSISIYALFISSIYGANEIIFALKFLRTLLFFFLLYFVYAEIRGFISYDQFSKYFVAMTAVHSIIILCAIASPDFRHNLYALTGYTPRGPEWSRSPGLTSSFNSTAIVHIAGLWLLLSKHDWSVWPRWFFGLVILSSFIFLGRFITFLGLAITLSFLFIRQNGIRKVILVLILALIVPLLGWLASLDFDTDTVAGQFLANYHHLVDPLITLGERQGADSYFSANLSKHIYFSDNWYVLLFGNSYSGHIGLLGGAIGETNSDIGVINSINANGIIITTAIYVFYILLIWMVRKGDWQTISIVSLLSIALSFKETGLFTSHATPLLFLFFFYQYDSIYYKKWPRSSN